MEVFNLLFIIFVARTYTVRANDDVLSVNNINIIKGIAILGVFVGHCSKEFTGLLLYKIFCSIGLFSVAIFFFVSGYGLMYGLMHKNHYEKGYVRHRILPIVVCYLLVCVFYWVTKGFEPVKLLDVFLCGYIPFSWYILSILALYLIFYLCILVTKNPVCVIVGVSIMLSAFITLTYLIDYKWSYTNLGGWQMVTFVIGMISMHYKEGTEKLLRSKFFCIIMVSLFLLLWFVELSHKYFTYSNLLLCIQPNVISYITPFVVLSLSNWFTPLKCTKMWEYLNKISLQIYLVHVIVLFYFTGKNFSLHSEVQAFLVWGITLILSMGFYKLTKFVMRSK